MAIVTILDIAGRDLVKVDDVGNAQGSEECAKSLNGSDRVLAILNLLGKFPDGVGLNELARLLNSPRSSVHRALGALRRAELVEQDHNSRYRLGYGLLKLAFSYYEGLDEVGHIRPVLTTLAAEYGETTHYAILDRTEVVYLAKVHPATSRYQMTSVIGGRNPAYCTGVGKALLAYELKSRQSVTDFIEHHDPPLIQHTKNTITTRDALHEEMTLIRQRGYALDREDYEEGINCIAIPLFLTSKTRPDGAVSITAVARRLPLAKLEASVDHVRDVIREHLGEVLA
jgi:IclR family acetate operon transcriptional repressor